MTIVLIGLPYPDPRAFAAQVEPTLDGYLTFIRNNMGIPVEALPDDSPAITQSFWLSMTLVNPYLQVVGNAEPAPQTTPSFFAYAVYNLAGHFLVTYAMDDPDADEPWNHYWKDLRKTFGLNSFTPGVIQSSSDQGTSQSWMVPGWMQEMSLADMQMLQTPWGRAYMMLAQMYGSTIWGLTP